MNVSIQGKNNLLISGSEIVKNLRKNNGIYLEHTESGTPLQGILLVIGNTLLYDRYGNGNFESISVYGIKSLYRLADSSFSITFTN